MIYITGDTHIPIDIHKLSSKRFKEQKACSKSDYLIICGDFGGIWDGSNEEKYWIKWFQKKKFTTLFIDGNHENHEALNTRFETVDFSGGKAHKICDGIYHLMRGEIYIIEEKRFCTMGGASSHDQEHHTEGKNWWRDELPNPDQFRNAEHNLRHLNWKVDYVIIHCAPAEIQQLIAPQYPQDKLTDFLSVIKSKLDYQHWFFGHYHKDMRIDGKHTFVFENILKL